MIIGKATAKDTACSARKGKLAADLIRGLAAPEAENVLKFTNRKAARIMEKTLKSAIANAIYKSDYELSEEDLFVDTVYVNEGITYKRIRPRAQGRAYRIRKRHSHFVVIVKERLSEEDDANIGGEIGTEN